MTNLHFSTKKTPRNKGYHGIIFLPSWKRRIFLASSVSLTRHIFPGVEKAGFCLSSFPARSVFVMIKGVLGGGSGTPFSDLVITPFFPLRIILSFAQWGCHKCKKGPFLSPPPP